MANITNVNELWGRKWKFKDNTSIPSDFELRNSVSGVVIATITRGTEVKEIYQADSSVNNVCFQAKNNGYIWIGSSATTTTPIFTPSSLWSYSPVILEFIENAENYILFCSNDCYFICWFFVFVCEFFLLLYYW